MKQGQDLSSSIRGLLSTVAAGVLVITSPPEALADCTPNSGMQTEEIVVIYQDGWTFADNRKDEDIVVCKGNTAELLFKIDPKHVRAARIHDIAIRAEGGGDAPADEFVIPPTDTQSATRDFNDKSTQAVAATEVKVVNKNRQEAVYDYTVRIKTNRGDVRVVDPKIRNGGGAN